jgi:hypothetical protein
VAAINDACRFQRIVSGTSGHWGGGGHNNLEAIVSEVTVKS